MLNNSKYPDNKTAFLFLLPCLLGCLIFIIIPVFFSFGLSFCDWNLLNKPQFAGIENYRNLLSDAEFFSVFKNTVIYAFFTTVFGVIIPLVLADILNKKFHFSNFFKTAYFIPFITPMLVVALVWVIVIILVDN